MANILMFAKPICGFFPPQRGKEAGSYEKYRGAEALAEEGHEIGFCDTTQNILETMAVLEKDRKIDVFIIDLTLPEAPAFVRSLRAYKGFGCAYLETPILCFTEDGLIPKWAKAPNINIQTISKKDPERGMHKLVELVQNLTPAMTSVEKAQKRHRGCASPPTEINKTFLEADRHGKWAVRPVTPLSRFLRPDVQRPAAIEGRRSGAFSRFISMLRYGSYNCRF